MAKLTKRTVDATKPASRDVFVWDDAVAGFGLRVLPSGKKSYGSLGTVLPVESGRHQLVQV